MVIKLGKYSISNRGLAGDVGLAWQFIKSGGTGVYMACANPHSLVVASKDVLFESALKKADILLPDGTGIIIAAKILGLPCTEKVAGTDFFLGLSRKANEEKRGLRYFFLGSSEKTLDLIAERMKRDFPRIEVCGTYSPPFKAEFSKEENEAMINAVNHAGADVLWVGMTAPKQEKWIYKNRDKLNVPFTGAIGAVFDFYAGTRKRSSGFWIKTGLEWLPRFLKDPGRLWERNLKSTPVFLGWVLKEKMK
jgi:N-acetylglucosaminyldiphosphoundecaprenol N-acetyl-beta-D-mannosaminyltransferase